MNIEKEIIANPDKYARRNSRAIVAFYVVYIVISLMIFARAADMVSEPFGRIEDGTEIFMFIIITLVWALGYVLGTCAISYTVRNLRDSITQKNSREKADEIADTKADEISNENVGEIHTGFRYASKTLYVLASVALCIGLGMSFMLLFLREIITTPEAASIFKSVMEIGTAAGAVLMFVSGIFILLVKKYRLLLFGLSFAQSSSALYFFLGIRSIITQMYGNDNLRIALLLIAGFIVIFCNALYAKKPDILRLPKSSVKD
jgi:MFS family permease